MGKKYVPSGYQIIDLDVTGLVDGDELPINEDSETLKELFKNKQILNKPILLHLKRGGSVHMGFVKTSGDTIYYDELLFIRGEGESVVLDTGFTISIYYADDEDKLYIGTVFEK